MVGKDGIHEPLVGGFSVLKAERPDIAVIFAMIRHEGYFGSV